MIKDVLPHPSPEITNRHFAKVVKFSESPIGKSSETIIQRNPRYQISEAELRERMYLSGDGTSSVEKPLPQIYLSRGREAAAASEPVLLPKQLQDGSTYQVIGIIGVKALGLRDLHSTAGQDYRKSSLGVAGVTETTIDMNIGDFLSEDGASVGDFIALLSIPKEVFFQHFEDPKIGGSGGKLYADHLREAWAADEEYKSRDYIDGLVRITDPERLDYRTFTNPYLLLSSALWLQAEMKANGKEKFREYYDLPEGYADHLDGQIRLDQDKLENVGSHPDEQAIVQAQARLLAFIITRNYAIALQQSVNTSFSNKDIGNLGKLHDFLLAMNQLVPGKKEEGGMIVDPELPMTNYSFSQLAMDMFLDVKGGSYLNPTEFVSMCEYLSDKFEVAIDGQKLIDERRKKDEAPPSPFNIEL